MKLRATIALLAALAASACGDNAPERDIEGERVPPGIIDMIENMSVPDGAVEITSAAMVQYKDVYYVVAARAETPDGEQIVTYLHAPAISDDLGNGGTTEPMNEAAQEWAPMAPAATDEEAIDLGERVFISD